jgi:hypothetical protein
MVNRYYFDAAILAALSFAIYQFTTQGKAIMSQQAQIDALTTQVDHVYTEVTSAAAELNAHLADLQAQIDAGVPTVDLDLTELAAGIQKLDDITPDAVVPSDVPVDAPTEPVDVPPADPTV